MSGTRGGSGHGRSARRRWAAIVLALAVALPGGIVGGGAVAVAQSPRLADHLEIRTATGLQGFSVEIADDEAKRAEGLMFRTEMAPDHGMLFDFRREQPVWFWMKNTYLSLDMIFVKADGTILSIAENTTPLSEATVASGGPVRFVFEVLAGTAKRLGIRPGDRVLHPRIPVTP